MLFFWDDQEGAQGLPVLHKLSCALFSFSMTLHPDFHCTWCASSDLSGSTSSENKPLLGITVGHTPVWERQVPRKRTCSLNPLRLSTLLLASCWSSASSSWVFLGFWSMNWVRSSWFTPLVIVLVSSLPSICLPSPNFCLYLVCNLLTCSICPCELWLYCQFSRLVRAEISTCVKTTMFN